MLRLLSSIVEKLLYTYIQIDITLPTKVLLVKAMVFPVVWMRELDCEES